MKNLMKNLLQKQRSIPAASLDLVKANNKWSISAKMKSLKKKQRHQRKRIGSREQKSLKEEPKAELIVGIMRKMRKSLLNLHLPMRSIVLAIGEDQRKKKFMSHWKL